MSKIAKLYDVTSATSISEVLSTSGTDWDVEVLEAKVDNAGPTIASGGFSALVRPDTNTALAFVGERFKPNNHRSQLYSLDGMIQSGDITPVSVSMWDNGALLAYQFRCPGLDVHILDKDIVSPLLTLAFAYGSQLADSAFFSDFRWFCKNQLGQVAKLNKSSRVRHRSGIENRFGEVLQERIVELGGELGDHYGAMRRMVTKPLTGRSLLEYFGAAVGASKEETDMAITVMNPKELKGTAALIPEIAQCYMVDDCGAPGTVWQAYNAVTRYETHRHGHNPETRQRRMLLGAGSNVANNAFQEAARIAA